MADWSDLKGLSLEEAKTKAARYSCVIRVSIKNGLLMIGTNDYRDDRVNVETQNINGVETIIDIKGVG